MTKNLLKTKFRNHSLTNHSKYAFIHNNTSALVPYCNVRVQHKIELDL
uniref:Uncharacterized protein n=1 Tax=Rhizophora mucronata TaxID=61149 RepID=A0A2P2J889_RHIMU